MPSGDGSVALALNMQRLKIMKKKGEITCNNLGVLCMPGTPSPGREWRQEDCS